MKTPLIISNFGDVLIFDSVSQAESYLEPIDVLNNEYTGYDSLGRLLRISIQSKNRVYIELEEQQPTRMEDLSRVLKEYLIKVGVPTAWIETAQLSELVEKGLEYKTN